MQDLQDIRTHATSAVDPAYRFARYVSVAGHPFVVLPVSVGAISVLRGGDTRAAAVIAGLFVVLSIVILVGIRAGRFNDFDVSEGRRRPKFYVLVIAATVALGFRFRDNPEALAACAIAAAVLIGCGLLNRWVKASLHTAFALYAAGLWAALSIGAGFVALAVGALIAWSRIRLRRHSMTEVLVGAGVGVAAAVCLLLVARNVSGKRPILDDAAAVGRVPTRGVGQVRKQHPADGGTGSEDVSRRVR